MELTMSAQEDATPWEVPTASDSALDLPSSGQTETLPGRAYFSRLGLVRRKPARGDAPPTLSKSCSDKLALKQCTSLLSSLTSLLIYPESVYIDKLVMPQSQVSITGCSRALSAEGRMQPVSGGKLQGAGGYAFRPFTVESTGHEFVFSKRRVEDLAGRGRLVASNLAVAWTRSGLEEASLGGTQQGRKLFDPRGASFASRRKMWALTAEVARLLGHEAAGLQKTLAVDTYQEVKEAEALKARGQVKDIVKAEALRGWTRNAGDDDFSQSVGQPL
jgi:tRNA-specific adenosine deaminase 1